MTRHTLPILVPGRSTPINVPCRLPDAFTFDVFLPSRGIRPFCAWPTSTDPLTAEIHEVTLAKPETDPRHVGGAYDLDEDEQRRADEAAADVLDSLLGRLLLEGTRTPRPSNEVNGRELHAIALAHEAERAAWEALRAAHVALHGRAPFYEPNPASDEVAGPQWASKAARLLEAYVERCVDEAREVQRLKAEKQQAEHVGDEDEAGSEHITAPRALDAPTLLSLGRES